MKALKEILNRNMLGEGWAVRKFYICISFPKLSIYEDP